MSLLQGAVLSQVPGNEGWPDDACLYQPFEDHQILLNENAPCLAVQVYIHMCGLDVKVIYRTNAEFMSPTRKLPLLRCGNLVISEPTAIIGLLKQRGYALGGDLSESQQHDMKAYIELVNNVLVPAELFVTWMDDRTYKESTCKRYGSPYSWPLNTILCWIKRKEVMHYLDAVGWKKGKKTITSLEDDVQRCCSALSEKLGEKEYFLGNQPTELDALVFGHLFTILTTRLPDNRLAETVRKFDNLVAFCRNIDKNFFVQDDSNEISTTDE
uniref:metaxin-2-like n=1 Tax=Styela clava TaxID=7725 RepID=UPI001939A154|nr:metaxin-2-like [Styela clava]XP_039268505.1 metaxin-2-like [Styela clava]